VVSAFQLLGRTYSDGAGRVIPGLGLLDVDTAAGGLALDRRLFPHGDAWRGLRPHQTRLQGGDASSDSYCYP